MKFYSNLTSAFVASVILYLFLSYSEESLSMVSSSFEYFPLEHFLSRDSQSFGCTAHADPQCLPGFFTGEDWIFQISLAKNIIQLKTSPV